MPGRLSPRRSLPPLALGICVWLLWPAQALARTLVRFIHAVPGLGAATVDFDSGAAQRNLGTVGFAQVTPWHSVRSGSFHWSLVAGGKMLASGASSVGDGAYDIVVLDEVSGVRLGVYRAQAGRPGTSLLRVIHAAPELGSPQLQLDSKVAAPSLSFTHATPYLAVNPGTHALTAMRSGDSVPFLSVKGVQLVPGVAYSAVVVGSRGQRVRVVTVVDRGAPLIHAAPHPNAGMPRTSRATSVVVRNGESLWKIARGSLGPGASDLAVSRKVAAIWAMNAQRIGTGDPNLIFPGQRLRLR